MPSTPYIGNVIMFGGNFPPNGWAFCQGQLLSIANYDTLFNLIGTTYGGDGVQTFGLPDLRGRVPIHMGQGGGLSPYVIGQMAGVENVTVTSQQMPAHSHSLAVSSNVATNAVPASGLIPGQQTGGNLYAPASAADTNLSASTVGIGGGSQPHDNLQPYLSVNFCIALFGVFPSQN